MFEIDNADNFHTMFMLYLLSHYFWGGAVVVVIVW